MRTIAGTFNSRDEAEAAWRRLEGIGVAPDAIRSRDAAKTGGGSGAVVLAAKVSSDQLQAATEILAGRPAADPEPTSGHVYFGGPADGAAPPARPATKAAHRSAPAATPQPAVGQDPDEQSRWWRKFLLVTGAALLLAFLVGALLGLIAPE